MSFKNQKESPQVGALKTEDAAKYLGIGRTAFYHLVRDGKIPFSEAGKTKLYRVGDLDEFLRPKGWLEKVVEPLIRAIKEEYGRESKKIQQD